jgi:cell division protein FtsW
MPKDPDKTLIASVFILLIIGIITLFSASSVKSASTYGYPTYYVLRQILYGILPGLILLLIFYFLSLKWLKYLSIPIFVLSLISLLLINFEGFGVTIKGATRWLKIGGFQFQPAEFLKLAFILYLARFFSSNPSRASSFWMGTFPFWVILAIVGILLLSQPATGTFGVISISALTIYFISGAKFRDILITAIVFAIILGFIIIIAPYRVERLLNIINPNRDPSGSGYQVAQSLIAIGSGGLSGVGFGYSQQKYNFLPETIGDSIFAIFAEEMGFLGALVILGLYMLILYRSMRIALRINDLFLKFATVGIAVWIVGQAFINISGLMGLLPLTGVPLPFFSYGGSSTISTLAAMGILFKASCYVK